RHSARRGSLSPVSNLCMWNAAAFTGSLWFPTDFKSTFDYYAVFSATTKIDLAGTLLLRREGNGEGLFWFQRREKLHCSYAAELRVLTPFNQRCKDFVENNDSRDKGRTGKMSWQTG